MGGGLMQLVAYGAQDIYLTGNPQITFFKVVYRRHTNFSMEAIEQTVNGTSTLTASSTTGTVTISRNGDLVGRIYVTSDTAGINDGDELVNEVELEIGGQRIDKHYKEWNQIWAELTTPESKASGYKAMTGALNHGLNSTGATTLAAAAGVGMVQVPLQFWFCRNPGLALPLIALQYHEVKLKFTWGTNTAVGADAVCKVVVDYIYLDTDERRRFAQQSHEYLIEQLQRQNESATTSMKLNFNHPVKELIWTSDTDYTDAKLVLNGHDRFAKQQEEYFQLRQPIDHHTAVPGANIPMADRPKLLNAPISVAFTAAGDNVAAGTYTAAGHGGTALEANQVGTVDGSLNKLGIFNDAVTAGTTATTKIVKIGDLIQVTHVDDSLVVAAAGSTNGAVTSVIAQVTAIDYTAVDEEFLTLDRVVFGANPAAADSIRVDIIARVQDPVSRCSQLSDKVNIYSFALKPEEHQPSGTCNFSRIDNAKLNFTVAPHSGTMNIYAVNYNVLRIMSGMGGLAYSN